MKTETTPVLSAPMAHVEVTEGSAKELAEEFGVGARYISRIAAGRALSYVA